MEFNEPVLRNRLNSRAKMNAQGYATSRWNISILADRNLESSEIWLKQSIKTPNPENDWNSVIQRVNWNYVIQPVNWNSGSR